MRLAKVSKNSGAKKKTAPIETLSKPVEAPIDNEEVKMACEVEAKPRRTASTKPSVVDTENEPLYGADSWPEEEDPPVRARPARAKTEKGREKQMVSLAVDLAEKQLREGTASAQVITHYLKLGTEREKLERQILKEQKELYAEKTKALKSMKQIEVLYSEAIEAMKRYSGNGDE